jgi:very-short-patch-repair endonuclease
MMKPSEYDDGLDADGYPIGGGYLNPILSRESAEKDAVSVASYFPSILERAEHFSKISDVTDSPIENMLGAAVLGAFKAAGIGLKLCKEADTPRAPGYRLVPQAKWGIYRSDWAIVNQDTRGVLLIECDGKEFHSSPEQIEHDRRKDQAALDRGWLTIRFTGSEIHQDADGIARRILELVAA